MKICLKCSLSQSTDAFQKHKVQKDGLSKYCKSCVQSMNSVWRAANKERMQMTGQQYVRTPIGKLKLTYKSMRGRCKPAEIIREKDARYANIKILITESHFIEWALTTNYPALHKAWEESGYIQSITPSIDRINSNGHYEIGNMQWLTLRDNTSKANRSRKQ